VGYKITEVMESLGSALSAGKMWDRDPSTLLYPCGNIKRDSLQTVLDTGNVTGHMP
jgi:hypothetical protein